jgi:hypothetical protein
LITAWNKSFSLRDSALHQLAIWTELHSLQSGKSTCLINVYGPYVNKEDYWEVFLNLDCIKRENVVVGGDHNFILRQGEFWGVNHRMDPLADYQLHKIEERKLCDVEPLKIAPTWRNNKLGDEGISKRT